MPDGYDSVSLRGPDAVSNGYRAVLTIILELVEILKVV
jgi:hypothetical protein